MVSFSYDQNVVAAGFLQREQRQRNFFLIFLILVVVMIAIIIIGIRVLRWREEQLKKQE